MVKSGIRTFFLVSALALAGCGNDTFSVGGLGGDGGGDDGDGSLPSAASLTLVSDAAELSSNSATSGTGVVLTAIIKDSSNNVISGQTVNFSSTSGALGPVGSGFTTDASGQVQAFLHTGGDPTNRDITVTARSGNARDTETIAVIGTELTVAGPDSTQFGVDTEYTIELLDGGGAGIPGETISVTSAGNQISTASGSFTTNSAGRLVVTLTPSVANTTITAEALGETATKSVVVSTDQFEYTAPQGAIEAGKEVPVEVNLGNNATVTLRWLRSGNPVSGSVVNFSTTRGKFSNGQSSIAATTDGSGVASVTISSQFAGFAKIQAVGTGSSPPQASKTIEFVATTPATIEVQASPSAIGTNQSSEIRAIVRDANQNLVKNQSVNFEVTIDESNGTLTDAVVQTDSLGTAKTSYNATSATSGFNGVEISASVGGITDTTNLTVGARSARVSVGTGSEILVKDESTYQLPFTVVVTDQNGNATPDANVTLSVVPYSYYKGTFSAVTAVCTSEDLDQDTINDQGVYTPPVTFDQIPFSGETDPSVAAVPDCGGERGKTAPAGCDPLLVGEDRNVNGLLEPGNVAAAPTTLTLDDDGSGRFLVTYAKDVGLFVWVDVIARVIVEGTETTARRRVLLTVAENDVDNLPGISPYGTSNTCYDEN